VTANLQKVMVMTGFVTGLFMTDCLCPNRPKSFYVLNTYLTATFRTVASTCTI